jgi:hypothetical protein
MILPIFCCFPKNGKLNGGKLIKGKLVRGKLARGKQRSEKHKPGKTERPLDKTETID